MKFANRYILDSARTKLKETSENEKVLFGLIESLFSELQSVREEMCEMKEKVQTQGNHYGHPI